MIRKERRTERIDQRRENMRTLRLGEEADDWCHRVQIVIEVEGTENSRNLYPEVLR
jgi:hypothetical protein